MNLPPSVRVGYLTCPIRVLSAEEAKERGINGYFDEDTGAIEIAGNLSPALTADAILHEMLHAACLLGYVKLEEETEERLVRALTTQLLGAMRDNPALFHCFIQTVRT